MPPAAAFTAADFRGSSAAYRNSLLDGAIEEFSISWSHPRSFVGVPAPRERRIGGNPRPAGTDA
jgi:hypothetical protein